MLRVELQWSPILYVVLHRRVKRAEYVPVGRSLHVVDLENLMGGPYQGRHILQLASDYYRDAAGVRAGDHVLVATNPRLALEAALSWPQAQLLVGKGVNGADMVLIERIRDVDWIASRFDRVVIGSGDGIFMSSVIALKTQGIAVGVVASEHSVSRELRRSSTFLRLIPDFSTAMVVA
jgi:hypothetical protein